MLTTVGVEKNTDFVVDFELDPVVKEIILPKIEYDYAKWNLREDKIEGVVQLAGPPMNLRRSFVRVCRSGGGNI